MPTPSTFDINSALTVGGGVIDNVFGFFGQSLKNKGDEITGNYAVQLEKIKQETAGNQQAYAVALAKLDADRKSKTDALKTESQKRTLFVGAALITFLGILVTTVLVLRRSPQKR